MKDVSFFLRAGLVSAWLGLAVANTPAQTYSVLHHFAFATNDGAFPNGGLVLSGNILYGTTQVGWQSGESGTVFKMNINGSGFTVLKTFSESEGSNPFGDLLLLGNTLYGAAYIGGILQAGTLFKVNTDGSGFTNLHLFNGSDGAAPNGGLVSSGNTLFGTTSTDSTSWKGMVFQINIDGTGFSNIYSFASGNGTGSPSSAVFADGTLYGMTSYGGSSNKGAVFKVNTDGSGFTNLYSFTGGDDGAGPGEGLVLSGSTLYGTTTSGGSSNSGTVFKLNIDGSGFTVLKDFNGSDGINPGATLALAGDTLYGTTMTGGASGAGTVFRVNTDGSGFTNLWNFTARSAPPSSTNTDGANPSASLVLSGGTLYGTANQGGRFGYGTVFRLILASPMLHIQAVDNQVVLTWDDAAFSLQTAPAVAGVYTNIAGATSPYTNAISGSQAFFRLQSN